MADLRAPCQDKMERELSGRGCLQSTSSNVATVNDNGYLRSVFLIPKRSYHTPIFFWIWSG